MLMVFTMAVSSYFTSSPLQMCHKVLLLSHVFALHLVVLALLRQRAYVMVSMSVVRPFDDRGNNFGVATITQTNFIRSDFKAL